MNWNYCDIEGNIKNDVTDFQIDEVGNILQKSGAVIPKACQKCKTEFKSKILENNVTQNIPKWECKDCDFKTTGPGDALDHKLQSSHFMEKTSINKIVGIEKSIEGVKSEIFFTEEDCLILCGDCV